MTQAPFVSTFIALALVPVAFLSVYAFLSGLKGWKHHMLAGLAGVGWDLSIALGYMVGRALGVETEGSNLVIEGMLLLYFIIHGTIATIVILLELGVIVTGYINYKRRKADKERIPWHKRFSITLFIFWWFTFVSGEVFYVAIYML